MRVAAGIILLILGLSSAVVPMEAARAIAHLRAASPAEVDAVYSGMVPVATVISLLLMILVLGSSACAFSRQRYWWALSGAIASVAAGIALFFTTVGGAYVGVLNTPLAVLAVIFLVNKRGEFRSSAASESKGG